MIYLIGCSSRTFSDETELLNYITDQRNGCAFHKSVNGYDFSLMYRPTDLLVQQELNGVKEDEKVIDSLRKKYKANIYINISISRNRQELLSAVPTNRREFGAMVNQLTFEMGSKVHFYTMSKDTIDIIDFVYPRMYGYGKSTTLMFVYPREEEKLNEDVLNFTIEDFGLNTGEVKFKIPTKIIKNEPFIAY